ncbi:MAG: PaaI family thioesterase [Longimicrobiales bacterium]
MRTLGAELTAVRRGEVEIELPFRVELTQQHGYVHAAAITAIVDSACGYAALTLMEPEVEVLSVEFKVNLLAPAAGERFLAVGRVLRSGRTLTVCLGEVYALQDASRKLICAMQATMITFRPPPSAVSDESGA